MGFDFEAMNILARQILASGLSHYVNRMQEVFSTGGIQSSVHESFRGFFTDQDVELKTRMKFVEDYIEVLEIEKFVAGSRDESRRTKILAFIKDAYKKMQEQAVVLREAETSSKRARTLNATRKTLNAVRGEFLIQVLGVEPSDNRLALLEHSIMKKRIMAILSIANTLNHSERFPEPALARALVQRYFRVLFENYRDGSPDAVEEAVRALERYINNFSTDQLIELVAEAEGRGPEQVAYRFDGHKSNREIKEDLIAMGHDPVLWDGGVDLTVTMGVGMTANKKRLRVLQAGYELVEIALSTLGVNEINGKPLTQEYYQGLDSYQRAHEFIEALRRQQGNFSLEMENDFRGVLESIKRIESLPEGEALAPQTFRARVNKDFSREATAGLTGGRCFSPKG